MKRAELREFLIQVVQEVEAQPFDYWVGQDFPVVWERQHQGQTLQIEIDRLELTDAYIHLGISADDGTLRNSLVPASTSTMIQK